MTYVYCVACLCRFLPGPSRRLAPVLKCRLFLSFFQRYIVRDISLTEIYRWLIEILSAILKSTRHGGQKDYSFLENDTFPNLNDALVYERKFRSEYLERQIYERSLKSEPSIVKLIENKRDLSKLSTLSEPSIVKFIENQSKHLSKLTLYHLKKRATRRSRRAREPSRIPLLFLRGLNKKNSTLKKFVFKKISTIDIPKSSKLHRYVNKVRKLYHARYKCNNKCDPKIINLNKMATLKKAFFVVFL